MIIQTRGLTRLDEGDDWTTAEWDAWHGPVDSWDALLADVQPIGWTKACASDGSELVRFTSPSGLVAVEIERVIVH